MAEHDTPVTPEGRLVGLPFNIKNKQRLKIQLKKSITKCIMLLFIFIFVYIYTVRTKEMIWTKIKYEKLQRAIIQKL